MLYLDDPLKAERDLDQSDAIWTLTKALLKGEWVKTPDVLGRWEPGEGLIYELGEGHPEGPVGAETDTPSVYEAAEQLWHLISVESIEVDLRCRQCGLLDPSPSVEGYEGKADDLEVVCVRCQTSDRLGEMRGVAPETTPKIRARRKMMKLMAGGS